MSAGSFSFKQFLTLHCHHSDYAIADKEFCNCADAGVWETEVCRSLDKSLHANNRGVEYDSKEQNRSLSIATGSNCEILFLTQFRDAHTPGV